MYSGSFRPMFLAICLMLSAFCIRQGLAQESTASINGTTRDATGALVPEASVTLTSVNTGVKKTTMSTDTGRYVFLSLLPGQYTLSVTKEGFASITQEAFTLAVNQTATFDFTLRVGEIAQTITVEASAAQINTSTANLGTAITATFVNELPLNGRQFTQLLSLTPGAAPANVSQNSGGAQSNPLGTVVIPAVNGQQNRSNYFMLDGINDTEVVFSSFTIAPIVDDIQEFKVQSHNDEAQFGYVTGGTVNVVTKSGTNQFHGALWEYMRNDKFDARNPFAANKISLRQNQFGANVGGPVLLPHYNGRNKTFFFGSYEGFRNVTGAGLSGLAIAPTSAQLAGDLSDLSTPIFNPFTTREDPTRPGQYIRDPFPGNIIPRNLIDANMVKYAQEVFPQPGPLVLGRFNTFSTQKNSRNQDQYSIRVDEYLTTKDTVWFRYSTSYQDRIRPAGFEGNTTNGATDARNFALNYMHTFNPTTILTATFGHNSLDNSESTRIPKVDASTLIQQTNIAPSFACGYEVWGFPFDCLIPTMDITGFIGGGEGGGGGTPLSGIYQTKADFSKIRGNHTFRAGYDLFWQRFFSTSGGSSATFAAAQTSDPQRPGTGSALASFLLGTPDSASRRVTVAEINRQVTTGAYFQDQWKATSRLTANFGLRWEMGVWPRYGNAELGTDAIGELDLNNGTYILQRSLPSCEQTKAPPCIPGGLPQPHIVVSPDGKLWRTPTKNFAPRVGLAFRADDRTSVRASFGIYYDQIAGIIQTVQGIGGDWPSNTQVLAQNLNQASSGPPTVKAENPLAGTVAALPPPTPFEQVAWYRDPAQQNPYSMQWNLGVQRAISTDTVIEANYVGSGSRRLTVGTFGNVALTPGPGRPLDRAPYNYIAPSFYDRSVGKGSYHAFQFKLERTLSHGFQYLVSYTWSKSIDIGCSGFFSVEGCSVQDPWNLQKDRSVSGYDLPHVLSASWVYQLGSLKTGKKFVDYALGNWQLNGIFTGASGLPYDLGISGDIANTGNSGCCNYGYERLNVVGDHKVSNPSPDRWFNTAAFAVPAPYTFGSLGRNALRGDEYLNFDISAVREFPLGESNRLQFRADMFNVMNHPVWGLPVRDYTNPQFGKILGTRSTARQIQFALKFRF
jgi:Carboxypeptidase regulatory-like domain